MATRDALGLGFRRGRGWAAVLVGFCWVGSVGGARAEPGPPRRFEFAEPRMGIQFRVVLYAADQEAANRAARAALDRVAALDRILSDYDSASELSKLGAASPMAAPVTVSPELWAVLEHTQKLAADSDGAFDMTVGPLTKLWRRARRQKELPPADQLAAAHAAVGYKNVKLDAERKTAQLLKPKMGLDAGGIAKGYAADEALAVLARAGIKCAMVAAHGDIALGDPPPGEKGWRIGVASLNPEQTKPSRYLLLANCGVSTSGDAMQFVVLGGKRYSHIVDPKTGVGLTHRNSTTVIAPNAMTADALATTLTVLGPARGIEFAKKQKNVEALMIAAEDENNPPQKTTTVETKGFSSREVK